MDIEMLLKDRQELLEKMRDSLQEELIACEIREAENENEPAVLNVVFDELGQDNEEGVLGEFFFLPPASEEDEVQHFSTVLTIADDIDKTKLPDLFETMSHINFKIPCGAFCIDEDAEMLLYRHTVPLPIDESKEALLKEMNICMANALVSADMYLDLLLKINNGEVM